MWFIAHARAHREPRVDTVTNVTIRGLRGARGEPAPERNVTCVVCGGVRSGLLPLHRTRDVVSGLSTRTIIGAERNGADSHTAR